MNPGSPLDPSAFILMDFAIDSSSRRRRSFSNGRINRSEYHHFVYFKDDSLEPGDHTLTVTVLNATGNISAIIDYLTYKPTFNNLAEKPIYLLDSSVVSRSRDTQRRQDLIIGSVVGGLLFLFILLSGRRYIQKRRISSISDTSIRVFRMSEYFGEFLDNIPSSRDH